MKYIVFILGSFIIFSSQVVASDDDISSVCNKENYMDYIYNPKYGDFDSGKGCNLNGLELQNENLSGSNLSGANLQDVKFTNVKLIRANLRDAILVRADLTDSNLTFANCNQANFTVANLTRVAFGAAKMNETAMRATILKDTDFRYTDVSDTFGLTDSSIQHLKSIKCNADTDFPSRDSSFEADHELSCQAKDI